MADVLIPNSLWRERLNELERDLRRLEALLDHDLVRQELGLGGKFGQWLGPIEVRLQRLRQREKNGAEPRQLWADLTALAQECRALHEAQLEFLGGVAISHSGFDDGFAKLAKQWLSEFCTRLGLSQYPSLIVGRGPLLEPETGIVRLTFPDWDLWHLPLLGRALGLLAATPGSQYHNALSACGDSLVDQVRELLRDSTLSRADPRDFIRYLFADMFAMAVVGPVYALAVFTVELDYRSPHQLDLLNPDQIEGREAAPRSLPAPVHRAAAILATLKAMNGEGERTPRPYTEIIKRIEKLWRAAIQSIGWSDPLDAVSQNHRAWHQAIYQEVIQPLAYIELPKTEATWRRASEWCEVLRSAQRSAALPLETTALVSAIWRLRLDHPEQASNALALANSLLRGKADLVPLGDIMVTSTPPEKVIAQARVERLDQRWRRVADILKHEQIPPADRAAIAGRFYRLLSAQEYNLEPSRSLIQDEKLRASIWGKLSELTDGARPLQREALEFLGGWLIREHQLDREPEALARSPYPGANICELADAILRDYAQRTGVNWNARTVLGPNPFLDADTEVIRVRFPDWSLWNLPLTAHEFGHLVARATPDFLEYQRQQGEQCLDGHPRPEMCNKDQRRHHLEEFFADIFATYTLGPAFACSVILLQFNPAEAYLWRGAHPSHEERVRVILQTLREMNRKACGDYGRPLKQLEQSWSQTMAACQATPVDKSVYDFQLAQSLRWQRKLYGLVDRFYRLGASYTPGRWSCAKQLAKRLLRLPVPTLPEIAKIARVEPDKVALGDILNALWYARLPEPPEPEPAVDLTSVAHQLARLVQPREESRRANKD